MRQIVAGSKDMTLKVWDAEDGQETLTLNGHTGAVVSVAFSPDGRRIVSGTYEFRVQVGSPRIGSIFLLSAIRRVSRTESALMSAQPPLDTAGIVSLRVCHPEPNRRRFGILISEMSVFHGQQSESR